MQKVPAPNQPKAKAKPQPSKYNPPPTGGRSVDACVALFNGAFQTSRVTGFVRIGGEGLVVAQDASLGVQLEARNTKGKYIDLDAPNLHDFLRGLTAEGVGVVDKFDEVKFEYCNM